jgi:hypothetical protein
MNTLRVEDLHMNTVLDRQARSMVEGGGWFSAVIKIAGYGYTAYKNRKTIKKYAKKGYGYAKKAWNWLF